VPVLLALGLLLAPAPARAQPANDDCANATVIPFVPFTDTVGAGVTVNTATDLKAAGPN